MRTITLGFGREVNGPYNGHKIGHARGVWLLDLDAWLQLQAEVINLAREYGAILFAGTGYGLNTVTGKADEPGFVVVVDYSNGAHETNGERMGIDTLQRRALVIAQSYGQLEFAFTDGQSELVGE